MSETDGFWEGSWKIYLLPNDVNREISEIPDQFELSQNYPNPFNPATTIKYSIPSTQTPLLRGAGGVLVTLKVYDILGREVATLVNKEQKPGRYEVTFDSSDHSSGIYIYTIIAGKYIDGKKMLLLK